MPYTLDPDSRIAERVKREIETLVPEDLADKSNLERLREVVADLELVEHLYVRAREYFETLAKATDDGVAILLDGAVIYANNRLADILQAKNTAELMGMNAFSFIHPDDRVTIDALRRKPDDYEVVTRLVGLKGDVRTARLRRYVMLKQEGARLTVVRLLDEGESIDYGNDSASQPRG